MQTQIICRSGLRCGAGLAAGLVVPLWIVLGACTGSTDPEESLKGSLSTGSVVEAMSLAGVPLERFEFPEETAADLEHKLAVARADLRAAPNSADALIWVARRTAYLGRYGEAIELFGEGVERFPEDARFLRHRGHRLLSTRQLGAAKVDLSQAYVLIQGAEDQVEPDGMPNDLGIPTSSLHSNIRYHLALVHYLLGEFAKALPLFEEDVAKASNPDMRIASTYWLYLTLRRLALDERAAVVLAEVDQALEIIENFDYHRLLLYFSGATQLEELLGEDTPNSPEAGLENATLGFGVATFDLVNGHPTAAAQRFEAITLTPQWSAFGYIAAEAELVRLAH